MDRTSTTFDPVSFSVALQPRPLGDPTVSLRGLPTPRDAWTTSRCSISRCVEALDEEGLCPRLLNRIGDPAAGLHRQAENPNLRELARMRIVASMPSMCGIAMSMRMTSGRSVCANAIASNPFDASPTTISCGCSLRMWRNALRTAAIVDDEDSGGRPRARGRCHLPMRRRSATVEAAGPATGCASPRGAISRMRVPLPGALVDLEVATEQR